MSRSKVVAGGFAVLAMTSLAACGGDDGAAGSVKLNIGHVFTDGTPINQAAVDLAEKVEEATDGRVQLQPFNNSQLGSDVEMAEALAGGTLDCAVLNHAASGLDPKLQLGFLPYIVADYEQADELYYGEGFVAKYDTEVLESHGLKVFGFLENDFRTVTNSQNAVTSPSDLANLKIRVPELPMYIELFEAWDAQPVAMAFAELYTSLQQGTVDGQDNGPILSSASKFGEVQKYFTDTNHAYATASVTCTEGAIEGISEEDLAAIEEAAAEVSQDERAANREVVEERVQRLADEGVEITELTGEQRAEFAGIKDSVWESQEETFGADAVQALRDAVEALGG